MTVAVVWTVGMRGFGVDEVLAAELMIDIDCFSSRILQVQHLRQSTSIL